jgi:biopolymer transport protein ExbB
MSILLQTDTLSVAQENLAEAVPVEKTSIFELLTSGGLAGNIIMASLFLMFLSHFIYFERLMAINASKNRR